MEQEMILRKMFPDPSREPAPRNDPAQAAHRAATDYETHLGNAIEAAFADGAWELPALVARLNADCIRAPDGAEWTEQSFQSVIARLAREEAV
jgi:hypothetical protein